MCVNCPRSYTTACGCILPTMIYAARGKTSLLSTYVLFCISLSVLHVQSPPPPLFRRPLEALIVANNFAWKAFLACIFTCLRTYVGTRPVLCLVCVIRRVEERELVGFIFACGQGGIGGRRRCFFCAFEDGPSWGYPRGGCWHHDFFYRHF